MKPIHVIAIALLLTGCSKSADDDNQNAVPVGLVSLGKVISGSIAETVHIYGIADAGAAGLQNISAPVESVVVAIDAPDGSNVKAGQVVVRLGPGPSLIGALAHAKAADATLARTRRMRADGLASDADVEAALAESKAADALAAKDNGAAGIILLKSPINGAVQKLTLHPGDLVPAGTVVATIARAASLQARFGIDPAIAQRLTTGAHIRVEPSAGGTAIATRLGAVDPAVDPATRLATIVAPLPPEAHISIGQAVAGDVDVSKSLKGLTVPYTALLDDGGQPFIFVVKGGVAHRVDVKAGPQGYGRILVSGKLEAGDAVVTAGGTAIEDGMKVRTK